MKWEELTGGTFEQAVKQAAGVCAIPIGVIEYHGPHLPLGTDMMHVHALATAAAEREPVIVYPQYHFGVNVETKHYPGGIVIKDRLMFDLLENICEEISRNGLKKIVLLSGHGGNRHFLPLFTQLMLDKGKDFTLYYVEDYGADRELLKRIMETASDGHAGETETSAAMHLHPELVQKDLLPKHNWLRNEQRLSHLEGIYTPADWFAMHPEHCAGDAGPATAEKGKLLFEDGVAKVADIFKKIKEDTVAPAIYAEFSSRIYRKSDDAPAVSPISDEADAPGSSSLGTCVKGRDIGQPLAELFDSRPC